MQKVCRLFAMTIVTGSLALFYLAYKFLGRLKSRDIMFRDFNGYVAFDIPPNLGGSFFSNKTSKTSYIDVFTMRKAVFHLFKHRFQCYKNIYFRDTRFFGYLVD